MLSKWALLSLVLTSQVAHATASTAVIQQIIDGYTYGPQNIHGTQVNVLESQAYKVNYQNYLRTILRERAVRSARPYIEEQDQILRAVDSGVATPEQKSRLVEVQSQIATIKSRENIVKLYSEVKETESENMDFFCYDKDQTTLRVASGASIDVRCIENESAQRIMDIADNNPDKASEVELKITSSKEPEKEGKLYYCYQRNKNILSQASSCNPEKLRLTDEELEKVGRHNCYPVSQSYKLKKEDGFTHISKLYSKCLDEVCVARGLKINYEDFEPISFSTTEANQCMPDDSNSRVCAQTYTCNNRTYQVTCEFDKEESVGDNKCNVKSINEDTMMNKCSIIELGSEV